MILPIISLKWWSNNPVWLKLRHLWTIRSCLVLLCRKRGYIRKSSEPKKWIKETLQVIKEKLWMRSLSSGSLGASRETEQRPKTRLCPASFVRLLVTVNLLAHLPVAETDTAGWLHPSSPALIDVYVVYSSDAADSWEVFSPQDWNRGKQKGGIYVNDLGLICVFF